MRRKTVWSIILVSLIAIGLIFTVGCEKPEAQTPEQDVPKYSADQVIAVVRAQYPACFTRERTGTDASGMFQYATLDTPSQVSVQFIGGSKGAWKVIVTCPLRYHLGAPNSGVASLTSYFWETDGALHKGYLP